MKKRIGMYVDAGSRSSGVVAWARLISYSPQAELILLQGDDLRNGKLNGLDLLLIPGGDGFRQYASMKPEGAEAVREFVRNGGKYLGICAGLAISMNEPRRIQLIKYRRIVGAMRGSATLAIQLSEKGASMLGVKPGRYMVRYSNGPLPQLTEQPGTGDSEVIATYDSTLGAPGQDGVSMYGLPAMICGQYGKGSLLVTSFHPESYPSTHPLALGCLSSLLGGSFTPEFPKKVSRPIRVAYYTGGLWDKLGIENALAIDSNSTTDLTPVGSQQFDEGILDHSDVLVLADGDPDYYKKGLTKRHLSTIRYFMERGGLVVVSGSAASFIPKHKRCIVSPAGKAILPKILELYK